MIATRAQSSTDLCSVHVSGFIKASLVEDSNRESGLVEDSEGEEAIKETSV